jgi:hypothetical protein
MTCCHCRARWKGSLRVALRRGWGRLYHEIGLCAACSEATGYAGRWRAAA